MRWAAHSFLYATKNETKENMKQKQKKNGQTKRKHRVKEHCNHWFVLRTSASVRIRARTPIYYHCYLVIIIKSDRLVIDHNRNINSVSFMFIWFNWQRKRPILRLPRPIINAWASRPAYKLSVWLSIFVCVSVQRLPHVIQYSMLMKLTCSGLQREREPIDRVGR